MNIVNMQNNNIGVLFDLDGVILDTEGIYTEFWNQIEEKFPTGVKDFSKVTKVAVWKTFLTVISQKKTIQKLLKFLMIFKKPCSIAISHTLLNG